MNPNILTPDLVRQPIKAKENSEFKPVQLRFKIDLVSYPPYEWLLYIYIYIYIVVLFGPVKPELGVIPSGQENHSKAEHLNFPDRELNVTNITEQYFL